MYQPLTSERHTRVLHLQPAASLEAPVECTLQEVWLDEPGGPSPAYRALSYAWGSKEGTVPITCNGQPLLVTPNCHDALRYLRHTSTVEVFWVDSICIRQDSIQEKNHQVAVMGEVFKHASEVVIWLGLALNDTGALFDYLSLRAPTSGLVTRGNFRFENAFYSKETEGTPRKGTVQLAEGVTGRSPI
jgi:Heterokaryon incompatibility protein (HET)